MPKYYLTVARKGSHSSKELLESVLSEIGAVKDPEYGIAWIFESDKSFAENYVRVSGPLFKTYDLALTERPIDANGPFKYARSSHGFARRLEALKIEGSALNWEMVQGIIEDKLSERDSRVDAE